MPEIIKCMPEWNTKDQPAAATGSKVALKK